MNQMVSSKGQVVIPREIRDKLKITGGQRVKIEEVDGAVIIIPIPKDPVRALKGISKESKESTQIIRALRKEWTE